MPSASPLAHPTLPSAAQAFWQLAPEPALVVDGRGDIVAANPAFEALHGRGMPGVSVAGRPLLSLLAPEDRARVGRLLQAGSAGSPGVVVRLLPARGGPVTAILVAGPAQDQGGQAWRAVQLRPQPEDDVHERLHRRVLDGLEIGVLWIDAGARLVDANLAARRMLALPLDDTGQLRTVGDTLDWQLLDDDGQPLPPEQRPSWRVLHGRQPLVTRTLAVETGHSPRRWLRVTAQAVDSVGPGLGPGAVVSFVDISEQRQAQRSQRESEMLLRLFGDNASDVLWIVDPRARRLLYVNAAWERLWGIPTARLYEDIDHWMDCIDPDDLPRVVEASRTPGARGFYEVEYRLHPHDGPMRWIRGRGFPIHDPNGRVRYLAGFAEDITSAREAAAMRQAHDEAQARLSRIVATAPGAVVGYRWEPVNGTVDLLYASPAIEALAGHPAADLMRGQPPMHRLVHPDDRARLARSLGRAAETRTTFRDTFRLMRGGHPDDCRWIDAHTMPVEENGEVLWYGFLIDATGMREAEEEVRQLAADLERRVAERTAELEVQHREMASFTYSVSHDLKAPLRGIDGYSKLLETDCLDQLDEEGRFFVAMIRKATGQMGQLIDDLLAYSRVERGRPALQPLDPEPLVRSLVQEREPELVSGGGRLVVSLAGGPVVGEREGLLLVLRNLVDNAIKFTAGTPARRIEVASTRVGDRVRLRVSDNGPGFDMRYHDRIFEIFQRLHRAEDYPGTGVGLAIVRKACERMHGRAWAESAPGQGATFWIELPAAPPAGLPAAPPAAAAAPEASAPSGPLRLDAHPDSASLDTP